tara:strand:- start:753 stop:995 length:243 start_codon:yes stop_codon:yes gene_type:complete
MTDIQAIDTHEKFMGVMREYIEGQGGSDKVRKQLDELRLYSTGIDREVRVTIPEAALLGVFHACLEELITIYDQDTNNND